MAWNCRPGLHLYFFIWRMKRVSLFLAISIRSHRERSSAFLILTSLLWQLSLCLLWSCVQERDSSHILSDKLGEHFKTSRSASVFLCIGCSVINATSLCRFIFLPRLWSLTPLRGGKSSFQDRLHMLAARLQFESERNKSFCYFWLSVVDHS